MSIQLHLEPRAGRQNDAIVNSYNEWDPLEEVVVGVIEGASIPEWHFSYEAVLPEQSLDLFRSQRGRRFPTNELKRASGELDAFARVLEAEGVTVRRPDPIDHGKPFAAPDWRSVSGLYSAMPRDLLIVVGNQIIEAPLSWRSRYFEVNAYRTLLKEYFKRGGRWLSAPRPVLSDDLYTRARGVDGWATNNFEPTFDAADFVRFGRDIFVQRSHVTNEFGIEWFERHIGPEFRVHRVEIADPHAMHIDATLVPLCPGKLLVNRERMPVLHPLLKHWDVLYAPAPVLPQSWPMYMSSAWVSMNVLMLDEKRVFVERQEEPLIRKLTAWGFECIPVDFRNVMTFGGSFHCVTLDVRRRGPLQEYLPRMT